MKYTILIVDDLEINLHVLKAFLENDYNIITQTDVNKAMEIIKIKKPDLILLDVVMPLINGFEVCKMLKQNKNTKDIPIVFLTSQTDEKSMTKGYNCGAIDYITKPYKSFELKAKIKTHLKTKNLISKLEYIAYHDVMTGILNRRQFFNLAYKKFAQKNKLKLFLVMIDIDDFKKINDAFGHDIGDLVLKKFTEIIKIYINESTMFARIGGEEFVLMCEAESKEYVRDKLENIRQAIFENSIYVDEFEIKFSISIGFVYIHTEYENINEALKNADINLYKAKKSGKNKIVD